MNKSKIITKFIKKRPYIFLIIFISILSFLSKDKYYGNISMKFLRSIPLFIILIEFDSKNNKLFISLGYIFLFLYLVLNIFVFLN